MRLSQWMLINNVNLGNNITALLLQSGNGFYIYFIKAEIEWVTQISGMWLGDMVILSNQKHRFQVNGYDNTYSDLS